MFLCQDELGVYVYYTPVDFFGISFFLNLLSLLVVFFSFIKFVIFFCCSFVCLPFSHRVIVSGTVQVTGELKEWMDAHKRHSGRGAKHVMKVSFLSCCFVCYLSVWCFFVVFFFLFCFFLAYLLFDCCSPFFLLLMSVSHHLPSVTLNSPYSSSCTNFFPGTARAYHRRSGAARCAAQHRHSRLNLR